MSRELDDDAVRYQALALADYVSRGGDQALWWASKDFSWEDRQAIRSEIKRREPQPA